MTAFVRTLQIGSASVSVINIGDIYLPLVPYMNVPEADLASRPQLRALAEQTLLPIHCVVIRLPHTTVLVDAGLYDVETEPEYAIPGYTPPPPLVTRLQELEVGLETIEHVIITHRHWDHFNATVFDHKGQLVPRFPKARAYLNRADWESATQDLQNPDSVEYRTLRVLHQQGLVELLDGDHSPVDGVQIIAAPGETPGHQIVRIHSEGQTLYCMGDLYHHPVEFGQPEWMVSWAAAETTLSSRKTLTQRALKEQALLVATHIPAIGRLQPAGAGVVWEAAH